MHTLRTCKKTKLYIYLYISLYENLFENGCIYIYIYIYIYIHILNSLFASFSCHRCYISLSKCISISISIYNARIFSAIVLICIYIYIYIYIYINQSDVWICRVGLFGRRHLLLLRVSCSLRSNHHEDVQNLKIQNNAQWRDMQKYDWLLSEYVLQEEFLRMSTIRYQFASVVQG